MSLEIARSYFNVSSNCRASSASGEPGAASITFSAYSRPYLAKI